MRRYPCNKGELTLIHIRVSGACTQILRRSSLKSNERNGRGTITREGNILYFISREIFEKPEINTRARMRGKQKVNKSEIGCEINIRKCVCSVPRL